MADAAFRVAFYDDEIFREHDAGPGHPERAERLTAVAAAAQPLRDRLTFPKPREATRAELERVHTAEHVARMAATDGKTVRLDPDTQAGPHSYRAALRAAGAALDAVDRILKGELDRAFCCVRPPGHHAEADRAMGFCLFNNVAVAAAHALAQGLQRVMVIDFDVHHGNGTQHIFESDPRVLYLSSHAFPFYPGTGGLDEVGTGKGRGFTVNLPMPAGSGDAEYARVYRDIVEPITRAFGPELLLVSAGFDPGQSDPISPMNVTPAGFAEIADACLAGVQSSARGRAIFALEGGYRLENLTGGTAACLRALLGEPHERIKSAAPRIDRLIEAYRKELVGFWPALVAPAPGPR
jgi:acetoin utilization deacetylase AcuC-like enzyme